MGVGAIVVLLHEGGVPTPFAGINACNDLRGRSSTSSIARPSDVDLFITGHTHQPYNCVIDGRPVTSASSFGRLVTDIDFKLDRKSKDIKDVTANNQIVTRTVAPAFDIEALITHYTSLVAPIRDRVIGRSTAVISRDTVPDAERRREPPRGIVIADAQLAASDDANNGQAVAAFMNPGAGSAAISRPATSRTAQRSTCSRSATTSPRSR